MPIYEYKCRDCSKITESLEKMGTEQIVCKCGKIADKIISAPLKPIFKGSGFYETDYKRSNEHGKG